MKIAGIIRANQPDINGEIISDLSNQDFTGIPVKFHGTQVGEVVDSDVSGLGIGLTIRIREKEGNVITAAEIISVSMMPK